MPFFFPENFPKGPSLGFSLPNPGEIEKNIMPQEGPQFGLNDLGQETTARRLCLERALAREPFESVKHGVVCAKRVYNIIITYSYHGIFHKYILGPYSDIQHLVSGMHIQVGSLTSRD